MTSENRIRVALLSVLAVAFIVVPAFTSTAVVTAQEAEDETEKKRPNPFIDDSEDGEDATEKKRPNPFGDVKQPGTDEIDQLVNEISTNMKRIEELLDQRNTSSSTQDLQKSTVQKIDELIEVAEKMQQQSSGAGSGSPQQMPSSGQDQRQSPQQQQMSERQLREQEEAEKKRRQEQQQQQQQNQEPQDNQKVPNKNAREGQMPEDQIGNLKDRDGQGRWGRLPKRVIEQMYDNGRRKLPEKYRLVLEEYYRRLPRTNSQ